jgi:alcohol dehydrogenase
MGYGLQNLSLRFKVMRSTAIRLIQEFKGNNYLFGNGCIGELGKHAAPLGKKVSIVALSIGKAWSKPVHDSVLKSLKNAGLTLAGEMINGAAPNAPYEDVFRICDEIKKQRPEVLISVGGGSCIDATKAAMAYSILGDRYPDINQYFGMGMVAKMLQESNRKIIPHVAVQTTAASAAHLTKYSNITDMKSGQKMLIIDDILTPAKAVFDYSFTLSQNKDLTIDGCFDGISHCLEVFMGIPQDKFEKVKDICLTGIELIVTNVKKVIANPSDMEARESIGLGTDLGGYAIMTGGTNGAHLNSFSLTDILSHGRAVALMNPYYLVFFSPVIETRLRMIADIYKKGGYLKENATSLKGRELGIAIANAMMALSKEIGFPTTLSEVKGFSDEHIARCLAAAKMPAMESKLKNMPVPLTSDKVDEYMGAVLQAAKTGNINLIKTFKAIHRAD